MSDIKIEISAIKDVNGGTYVATMKFGDKRITAELERQVIDGELVGFNFRNETLFSFVIHCCGLDKRFNEDFGRYLDDDYEPPWDYGVVGQEKIEEATAKWNARNVRSS